MPPGTGADRRAGMRDSWHWNQAVDATIHVAANLGTHAHICTSTHFYACILRHTEITKKNSSIKRTWHCAPLAFSVLPLAAVHPNRWAGVTRLLLTGHLPFLWHGDQSMLHYTQRETHRAGCIHTHYHLYATLPMYAFCLKQKRPRPILKLFPLLQIFLCAMQPLSNYSVLDHHHHASVNKVWPHHHRHWYFGIMTKSH